ncbi:mannose-1-phosphate guanylyltransferase [Candidatus Peregrinibacteria bacterium]|nr:mannose-1-phosphate guanylyltransferase [Candidatus Peregrinibacteria bacterium]
MKTVILAGGHGTRLWPMSRKNKPKQFQKLVTEKSMLQETIERLKFQKPEDIYVATISDFKEIVEEQTKGLMPSENIIIEPALRDTAPCIGYIATVLSEKYPESVMAVIYADHLIQDTVELEKKLKVAEKLAEEKRTLNIIEVKANFPNVNLGYVKIGKQLEEIDDIAIHKFEKFVEKPDLQTAKHFVRHQSYLWNTGLYVWKVKDILEMFKQFQPQIFSLLQEMKGNSADKIAELYPKCEKISVDYAIMEKVDSGKVRIIPADLGWNDIGTWESIWSELANGENNNVIKGEHLGLDTQNSLIYGPPKKLIATIGLDNIIVVDTGDALLIADKKKSTNIKPLIEKIKTDYPDLT